METNFNQDERYFRAQKRVKEIKGFYGNLTSYVIVNAFLIFINLKTDPSNLWFVWPLMGWGIGILMHGLRVFNYMPFLGKDWEERKMNELLNNDQEKIQKWD
jgi:2TM domain